MNTNAKTDPKLVAHRGYSSRFPENTILAIEQALRAGACYVEFDVHLTKDGVPVVVHDSNIQRTCGVDRTITSMLATEAVQTPASYSSKFQQQYVGQNIPLLADVVKMLSAWPKRMMFLEIKRGSLEEFGVGFVVDRILEVIEPWLSRIIVISFDDQVLLELKKRNIVQIGWVFEHWEPSVLQIAQSIDPDFVFADHECVPDKIEILPDCGWQWAVYEIDNAELAENWIARGAHLVETNDIGLLLNHSYFKSSRCDE